MTPRALLLAASLLAPCAVLGCSRTDDPPASATVQPGCCEPVVEPEAEPADEAKRLGVPSEFTNDLGMRFVLVPGGTAPVGSPADEPGRSADEIRHDVRIMWSFYVATHPVDAAQWARGNGAEPPPSPAGSAPATGMTHAEATAFARRLTERDPKWVYRLPTEAEWERAARATGGAGPVPAGANAWGVEGLADGVGEWCRDPYGRYPDWPVADPFDLETVGDFAVRGLAVGAAARPAARAHANPAVGRADVGLRLVARLSYGKSDEGSATLVFRAVETGVAGEVVGVRDGYGLRIIAVADRLESRQHGVRPLPWVRLGATSGSRTLHLPPGRYYAQAEVPGDGAPNRGIELKFEAVAGTALHMDLPVPKPGAVLNDPE